MGMAFSVQGAIAALDSVVDPAFGLIGARLGATNHYFFKGAVDGHFKAILPYNLAQGSRRMEFI